MRKQVLKQIITYALIVTLIIGLVAYGLGLTWVWVGAMGGLCWLGLAALLVLLEFLIGD